MSEKRKRDKLEYLRGYKIKKKEEAKMIKREKMERRYMGKEDVKVVAATLAPPSPDSASPSLLSFYDNEGLNDVDFRELLLSATSFVEVEKEVRV